MLITHGRVSVSSLCSKCHQHLCKHKLFLKIILLVSRSACLVYVEVWKEGSDPANGHRVFPGVGGHKFTGLMCSQ